MTKVYWVGVKNRPPQTVIYDAEENVTPKKYPQSSYIVGPFNSKKEANEYSKTEVNKDGTFTDPFCNNGGGR